MKSIIIVILLSIMINSSSFAKQSSNYMIARFSDPRLEFCNSERDTWLKRQDAKRIRIVSIYDKFVPNHNGGLYNCYVIYYMRQ